MSISKLEVNGNTVNCYIEVTISSYKMSNVYAMVIEAVNFPL